MVYAVCGAGKTELVFEVINYALHNKQKVGFAVPRRDVVIELTNRFKNTFKEAKVISLYGGNTKEIDGEIICLTTHQLYRYSSFFDLLILDEIDAFPFYKNEVLEALFKRSVKGNFIKMSATPDKETVNDFKKEGYDVVTLFTRYHNKPIPVPVVKARFWIFKYLFLIVKLKKIIKENKPCLIFVPTIEESENLYHFLNIFAKGGYFVNSKIKNRSKIIEDFRNNKYKYLVTTAILERGVTLKNLQVIIFNADNLIYNENSLIQISGRVGRKIGYESGEVIFIVQKNTKFIKTAISTIREANKHLQGLF